jgi:ubiquinone/menaquinone biosynthesis C-methylase UbiE
MRYIPRPDHKSVKENHRIFKERIDVYKRRDFDTLKSRRSILETVHPFKGEILEIGTGTGHTTLTLAKAGYRLVSVDKDRQALKTAALNLAHEGLLSKVEFHIMDAKALKFKYGTFKNIVAVNLFHHVKNAEKMFSEIDRVLSSDGRIVFADFNEKGMRVVNEIHKEEGRVHENTKVTKDKAFSYFHALGYEMRERKNRFHWVLVGRKAIKP